MSNDLGRGLKARVQTYRTNEQMMQAMKGATMALGSMNKSMNLPQLQRIAMEFERENDIMEQRQEMMDDAVDDAMDVGIEEEGDEVVEQVLEEIGIDLNQAVGLRLPPKKALLFLKYANYNICPAR
jgi:charged multivesicular body protein 2A